MPKVTFTRVQLGEIKRLLLLLGDHKVLDMIDEYKGSSELKWEGFSWKEFENTQKLEGK